MSFVAVSAPYQYVIDNLQIRNHIFTSFLCSICRINNFLVRLILYLQCIVSSCNKCHSSRIYSHILQRISSSCFRTNDSQRILAINNCFHECSFNHLFCRIPISASFIRLRLIITSRILNC